MYRKILLATDNSPCSGMALSWAQALAKALGAELTGIHVYNARFHECAFQKMESGLPERWQREEGLRTQRMIHDSLITTGLEIIAGSFLKAYEEECGRQGIGFKYRAVEGKNFQEILKEAENSNYDLVVIGAYGLGQVEAGVIGSVCERVVRGAGKDVLVVKEGFFQGAREIVVAVDGSPDAYRALSTGLSLASSLRLGIKAVCVFDPDFHRRAFGNIAGVLDKEAERLFRFEEQMQLHEEVVDNGLRHLAQSHLKKATDMALQEGLELPIQLLEGKPYRAILDYLEKEPPVLLITSRYGSHSSRAADLGSQAANLVRYSATNHLLVAGENDGGLHQGRAGLSQPTENNVPSQACSPLVWTEAARKKLEQVPAFCREMARARIEAFASQKGYRVVTEEVINERYSRWGKEAGPEVFDSALRWTEPAKDRIRKIPDYIRATVIKEVEAHARRRQIDCIDLEVLEKAKEKWQNMETFHESHKKEEG